MIITLIGSDQSIIENVNTEILILPPLNEVVTPLLSLLFFTIICLVGYLVNREILYNLQNSSSEYEFIGKGKLISISKAFYIYIKIISIIVLILTVVAAFIIIYKYIFQLYDIISDAALISFCILMASVIFSYFSSIEPYYQRKNEKKTELMKSTHEEIENIEYMLKEYCHPLLEKINEISNLYASIGFEMNQEVLTDIIKNSFELETYLENKYADSVINENIKLYIKTIKNYNYYEMKIIELRELRSVYLIFYYFVSNRMNELGKQKKEYEDFFAKLRFDYY
ncbi:MAG: hypothetical protein FWE54_01460 [Methanimicrococcus sp.]|nr:hypothetical protein [Methanimicrococcus sp.]